MLPAKWWRHSPQVTSYQDGDVTNPTQRHHRQSHAKWRRHYQLIMSKEKCDVIMSLYWVLTAMVKSLISWLQAKNYVTNQLISSKKLRHLSADIKQILTSKTDDRQTTTALSLSIFVNCTKEIKNNHYIPSYQIWWQKKTIKIIFRNSDRWKTVIENIKKKLLGMVAVWYYYNGLKKKMYDTQKAKQREK